MATKIDHINNGYAQLRISGITVVPTPQHLSAAMILLEDMMNELQDNYGVCVGYNFEEQPDPNTESGVKRSVNQMIATNVAIRLIPIFNKAVPITLETQASQSLSGVTGRVSLERARQVQPDSRMPFGSGYRYRNRFRRFERPEQLAPNNCDTNRIEVGEINDYTESFHGYLIGETITSFEIAADSGLTIVSSSNTDDSVKYRIKAGRPPSSATNLLVIIVITTSTGRVENRAISFEVTMTGAKACLSSNLASQAIASCTVAG